MVIDPAVADLDLGPWHRRVGLRRAERRYDEKQGGQRSPHDP